MTFTESLIQLADALDAERMGAETDTPEGSRYVAISDTLAHALSAQLRKIADDINALKGAVRATTPCQNGGSFRGPGPARG